METCMAIQEELATLRNENIELLKSVETMETALALARKRLDAATSLLTPEQRTDLSHHQNDLRIDDLTGLPNRATFVRRLSLALQGRTFNPDHRFAVLAIGVDRFRMVNDSLGHVAGNRLLRNIAQRLTSCLRATDLVGHTNWDSTLARMEGDEFAVLLDNIKTVENAIQISDRIQKMLATPFLVDDREIFASACIGVALSTGSCQSADHVLSDAEMAMYRAKASGSGRSQVFDSEMRANALVRWELETDLRRALDRDELRVYYQPKVSLDSGKVVGFEALLRWEHPRRGLISPFQFIPIAEETGLIVPIGNWVLRQACQQICEWNARYNDRPHRSVSVNLSSCQFTEATLFDQIASAVKDSGIPAELLWLEITESNLVVNTESAVQVLNELKAIGVGLMIDDFGTGYSSLQYLSRFPFDTLKIDQSFVRGMEASADGPEIVRTMLELARNLGMDTVAEGIETPAQLERLRALGCPYGQGFLFSKPLDARETEARFFTPAEKSQNLHKSAQLQLVN